MELQLFQVVETLPNGKELIVHSRSSMFKDNVFNLRIKSIEFMSILNEARGTLSDLPKNMQSRFEVVKLYGETKRGDGGNSSRL